MIKISSVTVKKLKGGEWGIYKNGRLVARESSKDKAMGAADWYMGLRKKKKKRGLFDSSLW